MTQPGLSSHLGEVYIGISFNQGVMGSNPIALTTLGKENQKTKMQRGE